VILIINLQIFFM